MGGGGRIVFLRFIKDADDGQVGGCVWYNIRQVQTR